MKHQLLTVGAALTLLPFLSTATQATPHYETLNSQPAVVLRCREAVSTDRYFFETESVASYESYSESSTEHHATRDSAIRDILRQSQTHHQTHHTENPPVVIEIQGDCEAIRVGLNAELQQNERFPGELDHASGYEEWHESLRGTQPVTPRPWLVRTGSGWDWLLRQGDTRSRSSAEPISCMCITAPCQCATFSP